MKKPEISSIIAALKKLEFKVFTKPFSMNLGSIRTNDNVENTFNDWHYMFYYDLSGALVYVIIPGTTDAGLTYRLSPMNKAGFPIIKHNMQYQGAFEYQNPPVNNAKLKKEGKPLELGHNGKRAFRQMKPLHYWRDNDKNAYLGKGKNNPQFESLPTEISIANTNGHDMGAGAKVNNWSAGCWGAHAKEMEKLYKLAELQIAKGLGKGFTYTMLHETAL